MKRIRYTIPLFIALLSLAGVGPVWATVAFECSSELSAKETEGLLASVAKRFSTISNLRADFVQQSYFRGLGSRKNSSGQIYFKKPGKMDWKYTSPMVERFVADGKVIWFYQPDSNQAIIGDFQNAFKSDLPVSFLLGVAEVGDKFKLESACRTERGLSLKLEPLKTDESLNLFYLLVRSDDLVPIGAQVVDAGDNVTSITFLNLALNGKLPDDQFEFSPPLGVDIIDQRSKKISVIKQPSMIEETDIPMN